VDNVRPMPTALPHSGLSSPTHQGIGARCVRGFGGTVRSVIAGGIALTGKLRRQAPQSRSSGSAPRDLAPPDPASPGLPVPPRRPRAPRRPAAAAPVRPSESARPGRFARWFGRFRRQPTALSLPASPDCGDGDFTPETCPGLTAAQCAFLNTPVEECDPELLRLILAALAEHIVDCLPPELGLDAEALFSTLCHRIGAAPDQAETDQAAPDQAAPDQAALDAPPDALPASAPAAPEHAEPGAPPAKQPVAPENAVPDDPPDVEQAAAQPGPHDAEPEDSRDPPIQAQGTEPVDEAGAPAAVAIVAWQTLPGAAAPTGSALRRFRTRFAGSRSFRYRHRSPVPGRRPRVHAARARPPGPPPRRLCYAACAGPP